MGNSLGADIVKKISHVSEMYTMIGRSNDISETTSNYLVTGTYLDSCWSR